MPGRALQAGVLACAALLASVASAEAVFQPPPKVPAAMTQLAQRAPFNALAMAGGRIVAAGQRGHILYSDDGRNWSQAAVPVSSDLTALCFVDAKQGWAVGHEGVILHTTDGGATWARQNDADPTADRSFLDVWFEDAQKGYAIGAFGLALRTVDGGGHWTLFDAIDNPKGLHLYAMRPAGGALFIVGEQGLVLRFDRETRRFVNLPFPYQGTLFGVTGTADMALVFGLRGNVWRSTDGGANWNRVATGLGAGIAAGTVRESGAVVLASQAGHLLVSHDNAETFHPIQRANPTPVFSLASPGKGAMALAGIGGVRMESID
ncbi:YCF48-related protein [Variovorax sp. Sphag1AA]|uniref:WD40/YVTN/BNR-like repeat-containing protein n=1 Tax=Variovorax sp. Sphag1AA TaxID=2587027 RepID=UPI00161CCC47|nr:YCF48-related protein [Variovorax sp. Sphag1AA]MBB3178489.1 photosystem II stability/assembly factor-like uncharacterized protein [Variovorax sp. Sphag1AA]